METSEAATEACLKWLDGHAWLLDEFKLPALTALYVYRCAFMRGFEYGEKKAALASQTEFNAKNLLENKDGRSDRC